MLGDNPGMSTTTAPPAILTVPELASELGLTLYKLIRILAHHPELREHIRFVGGRRLVTAESIDVFRAAVAESRR